MVKRFFDVFVSSISLVILAPLIISLAFLIRRKLGAPVLFTQIRPGLNGKLFKILKFRSMLEDLDEEGNLLPDVKRITRFGRVLRASSLDELPGLINVVKGDMSLVGPRPLLVEYLPLYDEDQARRHEVRPGITGWAQVNGRNAISWEDKFKFDVWYVDNSSFILDLKIIFLTIKKVIYKEGISSVGEATMSKFSGDRR